MGTERQSPVEGLKQAKGNKLKTTASPDAVIEELFRRFRKDLGLPDAQLQMLGDKEKVKPGDTVRHKKFGIGEVLEIEYTRSEHGNLKVTCQFGGDTRIVMCTFLSLVKRGPEDTKQRKKKN